MYTYTYTHMLTLETCWQIQAALANVEQQWTPKGRRKKGIYLSIYKKGTYVSIYIYNVEQHWTPKGRRKKGTYLSIYL